MPREINISNPNKKPLKKEAIFKTNLKLKRLYPLLTNTKCQINGPKKQIKKSTIQIDSHILLKLSKNKKNLKFLHQDSTKSSKA